MVTLIKIYKANLRTNKIIRDRERHYVIIKVPVLKEDVIVFNVYAPNRTSIKIHEAKTGKTSRTYRQIHYYSWRLK